MLTQIKSQHSHFIPEKPNTSRAMYRDAFKVKSARWLYRPFWFLLVINWITMDGQWKNGCMQWNSTEHYRSLQMIGHHYRTSQQQAGEDPAFGSNCNISEIKNY